MRRATFADVAEAFRAYWDSDTSDDGGFQRAEWRARRLLHRYALSLAKKRDRCGIQRATSTLSRGQSQTKERL